MRNTLALACILLGSLCAFGQGVQPQPGGLYNPLETQRLTFQVNVGNPAPPYGASVNRTGTPGLTTRYYWIVANYTSGPSRPAGPFIGYNTADTLSGSNYETIYPNVSPDALNIDVLRTSSPIAPSGACNCAVATAQAITAVVNDQSNSLNSYTVGISNRSILNITLTNEYVSAGASHLILRQNGVEVTDLSLMGTSGVTCSGGSGTCGTADLAIFTSGTTVADATSASHTSIAVTTGGSGSLNFHQPIGSAGGTTSFTATADTGSSSNGASVQLLGQNTATSNAIAGGAMLLGGSGTCLSNCAGAQIQALGGTNSGGNTSGSVFIATQFGTAFSGGVTIQTGNSAAAGAVLIQTGTSSGGAGANIALTPGTGSTSTNYGIVKVSSILQTTAVAFASLPACASGLEGAVRGVTDSSTNTYNATVTGSGSNHIAAYCNGTNWVAH